MKVETNKPEPQFYPVTITLESQWEFDVFKSLINNVVDGNEKDRAFFDNFYDVLDAIDSRDCNLFENQIGLIYIGDVK